MADETRLEETLDEAVEKSEKKLEETKEKNESE